MRGRFNALDKSIGSGSWRFIGGIVSRSLHELLFEQTQRFESNSVRFRVSPMFVQRHVTLKRLTTIGTFALRANIDVRTFMTAEIRELSVRFRTVLNELPLRCEEKGQTPLTSHFHGLMLE